MNLRRATGTVEAPTPDVRRTVARSIPARRAPWLGPAALVALILFPVMAFWYAPEDANQGPIQRIFYIHVPSAWIAFVAFAVVFGASIAYLVTRKQSYDTVASASAEIGFLFTTVVLATGMIWGKAEWGTYWTWEPRLTSFLLLWLLYIAYLVIRQYVPDPAKKARFSAVVGIVAFLDVPIVFLSVKLWRSIHPADSVVAGGSIQLPAGMLVALLTGIITFSLVYAYLLTLRLQVRAMENVLDEEDAL